MSKHFRHDVAALSRRAKISLAAIAAVMILVVASLTWALSGADQVPPTVEDYIRKSSIAGRQDLRIGVYADQPLVGGYSENPNPKRAGDFELGFETELAIKLAAFLGFPKERIAFVPIETQNRERMLGDQTVDLVVASYSITDGRKKEGVAFVGPYLVTTPEVLVRRNLAANIRSFQNLNELGKRLCTVEASTSAFALRARNVLGFTGLRTARDCVNGMRTDKLDFDAFMLDEPILAGYQYLYHGDFELVDLPLEQSEYLGIGVSNRDRYLVDLVANFLMRSYENKEGGSWHQAWQSTLGRILEEKSQPPVTEPPTFQVLRDAADRVRVG